MSLLASHPKHDHVIAAENGSKFHWTEKKVSSLLAEAGVRVNGSADWDITVHDDRLFRRLIVNGALGLGEAYVDGWWDCRRIDQLFDRLLTADVPRRIAFDRHSLYESIHQRVRNLQNLTGAARNGRYHYDLGNDLFTAMLDRRMAYSCGYWKNAATLDEAQEAKLDLVCRKIGVRAGQRVLDIGCGWGSFMQLAAERYGASCVGITISPEQASLARQRCADWPIQIRLQDYRDLDECFDQIISIGMFEHVGPKNHRTYMRAAHRCLSDSGLFLLHTIGAKASFPNRHDSEAVWINRHVFPGVVIPSMRQIGRAIDGLFVVEDVQDLGPNYDPTLMAWFDNFDRAWPELRAHYGERFYRTWKYYLLSCAGAFRSRKYQVWQFVMSKQGVRGGYQTVR